MSFVVDRETLVETLTKLQRETCAYDKLMRPDPPRMCDCKFGYEPAAKYHGEHNGCPELRSAVLVLSAMSDDEFDIFVNKGQGIRI